MVVEFLTFSVSPKDRDEWLAVEQRTWGRALEDWPGFVRKEIWASADRPDEVHAVIWWESREAWKAFPADRVSEVDASMGAWYREPTERSFAVLRFG